MVKTTGRGKGFYPILVRDEGGMIAEVRIMFL
jgi:hypothetical protein